MGTIFCTNSNNNKKIGHSSITDSANRSHRQSRRTLTGHSSIIDLANHSHRQSGRTLAGHPCVIDSTNRSHRHSCRTLAGLSPVITDSASSSHRESGRTLAGVSAHGVTSGDCIWVSRISPTAHRLSLWRRHKLQALVYDILPSTTAVFSYAIGSRKLSANEQFFVGAQTVVSLLQTTQRRVIYSRQKSLHQLK